MSLPLCAVCLEPGENQVMGTDITRDAIIKKFHQNELNFDTDAEKIMEANATLLDNMIESALAKDLAVINLDKSSADELARIGFLNLAYTDDYDRSSDLLIKAAQGGNAASFNFLGTMMYYSGKIESANNFISLALRLDNTYIPALYNTIMLLALNPQPDEKVKRIIVEYANVFYRMLATRCDPEKDYSYPNYRMMEIITNPRVEEESYKNLKYYMRGNSLLSHIRNVVPDYNPPVHFKKD